MRTDTRTFRDRMFRQVRALGVNSRRSKALSRDVVVMVQRGGWLRDAATMTLSAGHAVVDSIDLRLDLSGRHVIRVAIDGEYCFSVAAREGDIVNTRATERQNAIAEEMCDLLSTIYDAIHDAEREWDAENGAPRDDAGYEAQSHFVRVHPRVRELNARYDALRSESLAINPFADGGTIDPSLGSLYSDLHKDDVGFRPRGYRSHADMRAYVDARRVAANDEGDPALAA